MTAVAIAQSQQRRDPLGSGSECEFVDAKRRMGAGWDAIAAMMGRPTLDVRRAFDPEFRRSGFALAPVASAAPKATSVLVCGRRVPAEGLTPEELAVLKALAPGEVVLCSGLRDRVSGVAGDRVGENMVRRLVVRVERHLPAPLRIAPFGKDGYVIVAGGGEKGRAPGKRPSRAPDPFGLGLPPACVAVLKALIGGRGQVVSFDELRKAPVAAGCDRLSCDGLRARVSTLNAALPPGVRIVAERRHGYRLIGGEQLREAGDA